MRILFDLVIGFFFVSNFDLVIEKKKQVLGFPESEKIVLSSKCYLTNEDHGI